MNPNKFFPTVESFAKYATHSETVYSDLFKYKVNTFDIFQVVNSLIKIYRSSSNNSIRKRIETITENYSKLNLIGLNIDSLINSYENQPFDFTTLLLFYFMNTYITSKQLVTYVNDHDFELALLEQYYQQKPTPQKKVSFGQKGILKNQPTNFPPKTNLPTQPQPTQTNLYTQAPRTNLYTQPTQTNLSTRRLSARESVAQLGQPSSVGLRNVPMQPQRTVQTETQRNFRPTTPEQIYTAQTNRTVMGKYGGPLSTKKSAETQTEEIQTARTPRRSMSQATEMQTGKTLRRSMSQATETQTEERPRRQPTQATEIQAGITPRKQPEFIYRMEEGGGGELPTVSVQGETKATREEMAERARQAERIKQFKMRTDARRSQMPEATQTQPGSSRRSQIPQGGQGPLSYVQPSQPASPRRSQIPQPTQTQPALSRRSQIPQEGQIPFNNVNRSISISRPKSPKIRELESLDDIINIFIETGTPIEIITKYKNDPYFKLPIANIDWYVEQYRTKGPYRVISERFLKALFLADNYQMIENLRNNIELNKTKIEINNN